MSPRYYLCRADAQVDVAIAMRGIAGRAGGDWRSRGRVDAESKARDQDLRCSGTCGTRFNDLPGGYSRKLTDASCAKTGSDKGYFKLLPRELHPTLCGVHSVIVGFVPAKFISIPIHCFESVTGAETKMHK